MSDDRTQQAVNERAAAVRHFVADVVMLLFARNALMLAAAWAFCWGMVVLVLRVGLHLERPAMLWGLCGLPVVLIAALWVAYRRRPRVPAVQALLDEHNRCGGLLMTEGEQEIGSWSQRIGSSLASPRLRWRGRRTWLILLASAVFVLGCFVVPDRFAALAATRPLDVSEDVAQLNEQIKTLEQESIIEQKQATELKQKLEQVRRDATGNDPVKTWEALDHLNKKVADAAAEAVEDALQQTEQLAQTQTLAQALNEDGDKLSPDQFAAAMQTLQQMTQEALAENQALRDAIDSKLADALGSASLSPEQLKQLAQAMQLSKAELRQMLMNLKDVKLCDLKKLSMCNKLGQCHGEGFCESLTFCMNYMTVRDALKSHCGGGISRGRGDAELTFSAQAASSEGAKFKDQVLPPATLAALKDSQVVGMGSGAPQLETGADPSAGGALAGAASGGGSAVSQTVLPRHRAAVQRYFERQSDQE